MAAIEVDALTKQFDVPGGVEMAVDGIELKLEGNEFLTIVGPSGCGKTTTLRCIAGLEIPTSGTIRFGGEDVTDVPANKRNLAMMFQNIALYPHMTIKENIAYPLKVRNVPRQERWAEAERAAELMQIPNLLEKYPGELSGGQRQRAALARTVVQDPEAFLMDEPLSDLDAKLKVEVRKEIQRVHRRVERPTIYVTHDQEEAMTMSDYIAVMNDGQIEQLGTPDELYSRPTNRFVAEFIGNPSINFIEGELISLNSNTAVASAHDAEFKFDVEVIKPVQSGVAVTIGFRPETLLLEAEDADFFADVSLIERTGDRLLVTLDGPEGEIRATVPVRQNTLEENDRTGVRIDRSQMYLFEPSGDLIARGLDS